MAWTPELYDDPKQPPFREALAQTMREGGWAKAVAFYSGGNDSGGIDRVATFTEDGAEEDCNFVPPDRGDVTPSPFARLCWFLDQLVDQRYGSFAGEYDCQGEVSARLVPFRVIDREPKLPLRADSVPHLGSFWPESGTARQCEAWLTKHAPQPWLPRFAVERNEGDGLELSLEGSETVWESVNDSWELDDADPKVGR